MLFCYSVSMNLRAKKSLGQNFLNAPQVVSSMIESSSISSEDIVVEVGPGKGVLTEALLERGYTVHAYELDIRMIEYLSERLSSYIESGLLILIHADIMEIDLAKRYAGISYVVIANVPYYITSAIIRLFLSSVCQPKTMTLLIQKEVASRIVDVQKNSLLALSVAVYGKAKMVTKVPRRYFSPKPKVDSAVITISNISRNVFSDINQEQAFFNIIKAGFAHKRKQLASNLALLWKDKEYWQQILINRGYSKQVRAEAVSLQDFLFLASCL